MPSTHLLKSMLKKGISHNAFMIKGPSLMSQIAGLLLRLGIPPIGVTAGIKRAPVFLQIGINEPDRDAHRFVWVDDPSNLRNMTIDLPIQMCPLMDYVQSFHLDFVDRLIDWSIFFKYHIQSSGSTQSDQLMKNIFVNNLVLVEGMQCRRSLRGIRTILGRGSSMARSWTFMIRSSPNSSEFLDGIPQLARLKGKNKEAKPLWNKRKDKLCFEHVKGRFIANDQKETDQMFSKLTIPMVSRYTPLSSKSSFLFNNSTVTAGKWSIGTCIWPKNFPHGGDFQKDFLAFSTIQIPRYMTSLLVALELHINSQTSQNVATP